MRRRMGGIVCAAALALGIMDRALCQQTNGGRPPIEIQQKLPESPTPGQPVLIEIHIRNRSEQRVENVIAAVTLTEGWQALDAEPSSERTPGAMLATRRYRGRNGACAAFACRNEGRWPLASPITEYGKCDFPIWRSEHGYRGRCSASLNHANLGASIGAGWRNSVSQNHG